MAHHLIAAPVLEPVSLEALKERLSIDHSHADSLLTALLVAARATMERLTRRPFLSQGWRVMLDELPPGGLVLLPLTPVQTVSEVRVKNAAGVAEVCPAESLLLDLCSEPARLLFQGTLPIPGVPLAGIEIDVVAGYGPAPDSVPEPLRQAILLLAAHWYEARGVTETNHLPPEVERLAFGYRTRRLAA